MGKFKNGEELCMKVSEEFEDKYKVGVLFKLRKKIYWLKQVAMMFWKLIVVCMESIEMVMTVYCCSFVDR